MLYYNCSEGNEKEKTRPVLKTRKVTTMKKTTMQALVSYLTQQNSLPSDIADAVDEIKAELNRNAEKAQENRDKYEAAHDIVIHALTELHSPVTIGELYNSLCDELPDSFSKGKLQYAITRLWANEIQKHEGKVNTYSLA